MKMNVIIKSMAWIQRKGSKYADRRLLTPNIIWSVVKKSAHKATKFKMMFSLWYSVCAVVPTFASLIIWSLIKNIPADVHQAIFHSPIK